MIVVGRVTGLNNDTVSILSTAHLVAYVIRTEIESQCTGQVRSQGRPSPKCRSIFPFVLRVVA